MLVRILGFDKTEHKVMGTLRLTDDGKIVMAINPAFSNQEIARKMVKSVAMTPLTIDGRKITPSANPSEFLSLLYKEYTGSYFRVSRPSMKKYSEDQPRDEAGRWAESGAGRAATGEGAFAHGTGDPKLWYKSPAELTAWAKGAAEKFGVSSNDLRGVKVHDGDGPIMRLFEEGGIRTIGTTAQYNPETKEIEVWIDQMGEDQAGGILAHELFHAKFTTENDEAKDVITDIKARMYQNPLEEHVSDYAKMWWDEYRTQRSLGALDAAVDESLAETAKFYARGQKDRVPQYWRDQYEKFTQAYAKANKK